MHDGQGKRMGQLRLWVVGWRCHRPSDNGTLRTTDHPPCMVQMSLLSHHCSYDCVMFARTSPRSNRNIALRKRGKTEWAHHSAASVPSQQPTKQQQNTTTIEKCRLGNVNTITHSQHSQSNSISPHHDFCTFHNEFTNGLGT